MKKQRDEDKIIKNNTFDDTIHSTNKQPSLFSRMPTPI